MNLFLAFQVFGLIVNFSLLIYVYSKLMKLDLGRLFFPILVALTVWLFGSVIMNSSDNTYIATQWDRLVGVGAIFAGPALFWFVIGALYPRIYLKKYIIYILLLLSFVFLILLLKTDAIVGGTIKENWGYYVIRGPLYSVYSLYISGITLISLLMSSWKLKKLKNLQRKQVTLFTIAIFIPFVGGSITEVVLPLMNIGAPPVSTVLFCFTGLIIAFAIKKYQFLSISPALALEKIFNTMHDALIVVNNEGKVVLFNNAATKITNCLNNELFEKDITSLLLNIDGTKMLMSKIFEKRLEDEEMLIVQNQSEKPIQIEMSSASISSHKDFSNGIVLVLHDITKQKELYKHLEAKTTELEKSKLDLEEALDSMKKINNSMINRELRMIELKEENKQLKDKLENTGKN